MFSKPKYTDPSEDLRKLAIVFAFVSFFPHFLFLMSNIRLEKVNPLLCHILLQKHFHFEMLPEKKDIFKVSDRTP